MSQRERENGQAMVEYALTAVVLFSMLLFIIDGGRILWNYVSVAEAARVGARYAITHGALSTDPAGPSGYTALTQYIRDQVVGLDPASLTVTATWNPNNSRGSTVTVSVSYQARAITAMFWSGQTLTLASQSTMVIQN